MNSEPARVPKIFQHNVIDIQFYQNITDMGCISLHNMDKTEGRPEDYHCTLDANVLTLMLLAANLADTE